MGVLLKIALRVISRRVEAGEDLELTEEEKEFIRKETSK